MDKLWMVLGVLCCCAGATVRAQDQAERADHTEHVVARPDEIQWGPPPPGLPSGSQLGVLLGDPTKTGVPFVFRAKLPDGYTVPPHWHPTDESVTVLKGALLVGQGDEFDRAKTDELTVGSFFHMPKTMRHFVVAKGETVIQVHGIGPFGITYVDPADDPRNSKTE